MIHPALPELVQVRVGDRDTTEARQHEGQERRPDDSDLEGGRDGRDELSERYTEQHHEQNHEQLESSAVGACRTLAKAHGIDEQDPVEDGT